MLGTLSAYVDRAASPEMFRVLGELELSFTQMKALFVLPARDEMTVKDIAGHLSTRCRCKEGAPVDLVVKVTVGAR